MANLQAKNFPPEFSTDGTTWKTLVCVNDWDNTGSSTITTEDTFCGTITSTGTPSFKGTANAVCETAPTTSQVSYEDALGWFTGSTLLYFRVQSPANSGTEFYTKYQCYITNCGLKFAATDVVKFTIEWTSTGAIDVTP